MSGVVAALAPLAVMLVLCLPAAVGTVRRLAGSAPHRGLPLVGDRWEVVEASALGVIGLALGLLGPWHQVPVAVWGLAAVATALTAVGGALAWRDLPVLAADREGRPRPRSRRASAVASLALAAVAVVVIVSV